jgi:hypothetical protein
MPIKAKSSRQSLYFIIGLATLCLLYLSIQIFLNCYLMLAIDEFWFAHIIYHYQNALPYRDFAPYKTVLGYYLLLFPLLGADYLSAHFFNYQNIFTTLILTKQFIALFNACILFFSSLWLIRHFSRAGVITSLALLITSDIVLSYSANIRVDLLGYWFCFFALLFLLEQRFFLAGLLLGLGFVTTQKAIWYIFAANFALALQWIIFSRKRILLKNIIYCNIAIACVITSYILFWAEIADINTLIASLFHESSILYHLDWYSAARKLFWTSIIFYNPLLFALWPLTLISLVVSFDEDKDYAKRFFIVSVGMIILLCLIPYKMIFPYYMQVTIPILLLVYAAFFSWLYKLFQPNQSIIFLIPSKLLNLFFVVYSSIIIYVIIAFELPLTYILVSFIPFLLYLIINKNDKKQPLLSQRSFFIALFFMGGIYPLTSFYLKVIKFHSDYQKAHLNVIDTLLQDGSDYVAGIELIYNKTQKIAGMRQLVGPAIDYLYRPTAKLRPFMLASLYQDPHATSASIISALKQSQVKFYVNNYRMAALPLNIKNYLTSHYEHLWGSIYLYAPRIAPGTHPVTLKFSGRYLIEADLKTHLSLAGKSYPSGTVLYFKKGTYSSSANHSYRLKLLPEKVHHLLNQAFQREQLIKIVW